MLNRLIDLIVQFLSDIMPVYIVMPYEEGVTVFMGHYRKTVGPGWYWKWPFMHSIIKDNVVPTTAFFAPQYITLKSGETVAVKFIVLWSIEDIRTFLLDVESAESVLGDSCVGLIAEHLQPLTFKEVLDTQEWKQNLKARLTRKANNFGVKIHSVQFGSITKVFALGHIGDTTGVA